MKVVISNRIYIPCKSGTLLESQLLKALRFEICQQPVSPYPKVINLLIRVTPNIVSIPGGCRHLIPEGAEIIDKTVMPPANIPPLHNITLRPDQQKAVDTIKLSGLINAKPGWGKTFAGLSKAHELQTKTLIVTTTTVIRDMWVAEIEEYMKFTPGIIGGGKFDIEPPIVVGNIQTIRNRHDQIKDVFGLVIVDEVHRASAPTFTSTLDSLFNRVTLGLSGTLERKDGMHVVLPAFFGDKVFVGADENRLEPEVHLWSSMCELSANEFIPWSIKVNNLMSNPSYIREVSSILQLYLEAGHKILVVADRTDFLKQLHLEYIDDSFLITGEVKERQEIMKQISNYPKGIILFATQSIFSEGVSLNELSAILLGSPINNDPLLEQLIGRIQRSADTKLLKPAVIDINLSGSTGKRQANQRKKFYVSKGWQIKSMN